MCHATAKPVPDYVQAGALRAFVEATHGFALQPCRTTSMFTRTLDHACCCFDRAAPWTEAGSRGRPPQRAELGYQRHFYRDREGARGTMHIHHD